MNVTRRMLTFCQPIVDGLPLRTKPYRNSRIITVIRDLFFAGGTSSISTRFDFMFPRFRGREGTLVPEVPPAMVALVATAVRATYQLEHYTDPTS